MSMANNMLGNMSQSSQNQSSKPKPTPPPRDEGKFSRNIITHQQWITIACVVYHDIVKKTISDVDDLD